MERDKVKVGMAVIWNDKYWPNTKAVVTRIGTNRISIKHAIVNEQGKTVGHRTVAVSHKNIEKQGE